MDSCMLSADAAKGDLQHPAGVARKGADGEQRKQRTTSGQPHGPFTGGLNPSWNGRSARLPFERKETHPARRSIPSLGDQALVRTWIPWAFAIRVASTIATRQRGMFTASLTIWRYVATCRPFNPSAASIARNDA